MIDLMIAARLEQMIRARWLWADAIVDELGRDRVFATAYSSNVGLRETCSLRTHTLRVLDCYEKHFAQLPQTDSRWRGCFRIFLALHDIGKPAAMEAGDKRLQHQFTVRMMRQTRSFYPVADREFENWIALVDGDPLGSFLKGDISAPATLQSILRMSSRSSLDRADFVRSLLTYYQCDVSAYTSRAGSAGVLDDLFEWRETGSEIAFDERGGLLKFADQINMKLEPLIRELIGRDV